MAQAQQPNEDRAEEGTDGGVDCRVVIADENPVALDGLRALLGVAPGVEVLRATGRRSDVLDSLATLSPDVLVIDIAWRGVDGVDLTRRIKATWPGVKMVVLTSCVECRDDALAAGADCFLIKGCPSAELIAAVTARSGV